METDVTTERDGGSKHDGPKSMVASKLTGLMEAAKSRTDGLSQGIPSEPILGLPLARILPMDAHSALDYSGGVGHLLAGLLADSNDAKLGAMALGGAVIGTSLLTDYKLSLAKVIPIEAHEVADYAAGLAAILSPFVFGYYRKSILSSAIQIAVGATTIIGSLITDYRAYRGVRWLGRARQAATGALPVTMH